jgi:hypothetical protein
LDPGLIPGRLQDEAHATLIKVHLIQIEYSSYPNDIIQIQTSTKQLPRSYTCICCFYKPSTGLQFCEKCLYSENGSQIFQGLIVGRNQNQKCLDLQNFQKQKRQQENFFSRGGGGGMG